jgi:hypothetical protein
VSVGEQSQVLDGELAQAARADHYRDRVAAE